ncbi:MAG: type I-E CRISPR-associated protein Cas6/Cse3/CasE [Faecalibacterium prausnitzii]
MAAGSGGKSTGFCPLREEKFTVTRVQWQRSLPSAALRPVTHPGQATYGEGVLQVTDAERFRAMLCQGWARRQARGLGLMTVMHLEEAEMDEMPGMIRPVPAGTAAGEGPDDLSVSGALHPWPTVTARSRYHGRKGWSPSRRQASRCCCWGRARLPVRNL